jgi:hypothetical protein
VSKGKVHRRYVAPRVAAPGQHVVEDPAAYARALLKGNGAYFCQECEAIVFDNVEPSQFHHLEVRCRSCQTVVEVDAG